MNKRVYVAVPIALLTSLSGPAWGGGKLDPSAPIHRLCTIHANFPADPLRLELTVEGRCAQDIFQLLSHESVLSQVSADGVESRIGEGIVCRKKPGLTQNFTYDCIQIMNTSGGLLPGAYTSSDPDLFDRLQYSRISINGSTASKIYQFLTLPPEDMGGTLEDQFGSVVAKCGERIACSMRSFGDGRPTAYECGQRLKTNGVAKGTGDWEVGGSITVGNMVYLHESRD